MRLEPVLTLDQREELEALEAEEILQKGVLMVIGQQVMARIAKGPRFQVIGDVVRMRDREYVVRPDGSLGRLTPKALRSRRR